MEWTRKASGYFEGRNDRELVATVTRVRDSGEPLWSLAMLDGTPTPTTAGGHKVNLDRFTTANEAQTFYKFAKRRAAQ